MYSWSLPKIVYDFVEKIDLSNVNYIFSVTTMAGISAQYVPQVLNRLLEPKNKVLNFSRNLKIFSNNIWALKRMNPVPSKEKIDKKIKNAELKLENIAEKIRTNQKEKPKTSSKYPPMKKGYKEFLRDVNTMDKEYYIDEKCNGCGICQKLCPVENIKLVNEKPEWQHKCQMCTSCLHYCPQTAIQWGENTLGRARYNHPKIKMKELIAQNQ